MRHSFRVQSGFTLVEAILAYGLTALFIGTVLSFALNIADLNLRRETAHTVASEAAFVSERIASILRNAEGIQTVTADRAVLELLGTSDVGALFVRDGVLYWDNGTAEAALTGSRVTVASLTFTEVTSESDLSRSLQYEVLLRPTGVALDSTFRIDRTIRGMVNMRNDPLP